MINIVIEFILHIDLYLAAFIQNYGGLVYALLFFIIFMETGFVLAPFLPGDSLLFISGAFAAVGALNAYILFFVLGTAAILGDSVNYWIGYYFGEKVFLKFIKVKHIKKTKLFFDNHGKKTIVFARFIPIIRTLAPFLAGVGKMNYFTFFSYNIIGGVAWVAVFIFSGFYFGNIPYVKNNLTDIVFAIIIVSFIPAIFEYLKHRKVGARKPFC